MSLAALEDQSWPTWIPQELSPVLWSQESWQSNFQENNRICISSSKDRSTAEFLDVPKVKKSNIVHKKIKWTYHRSWDAPLGSTPRWLPRIFRHWPCRACRRNLLCASHQRPSTPQLAGLWSRWSLRESQTSHPDNAPGPAFRQHIRRISLLDCPLQAGQCRNNVRTHCLKGWFIYHSNQIVKINFSCTFSVTSVRISSVKAASSSIGQSGPGGGPGVEPGRWFVAATSTEKLLVNCHLQHRGVVCKPGVTPRSRGATIGANWAAGRGNL